MAPEPLALDQVRPTWKLLTDGSSNQQESGAGMLHVNPKGERLEYALRFEFKSSNTEAEYEALIIGMNLMGAEQIRIQSDSQLIVNQISNEYEERYESMKRYLEYVRTILDKFVPYVIMQV